MASEGYHEPIDLLAADVMERHRAITSLKEELEAVDWYDQRVSATSDNELREILAHNRDEEKEHAAMTLEWIRRRDAKWNEVLRTYLFTEGSETELEEIAEAGYWRLGLAGEAEVTLAEALPAGPVALVLGAEGEWMRHNIGAHCDALARLPISNAMESLNVSNAAAIALYAVATRE